MTTATDSADLVKMTLSDLKKEIDKLTPVVEAFKKKATAAKRDLDKAHKNHPRGLQRRTDEEEAAYKIWSSADHDYHWSEESVRLRELNRELGDRERAEAEAKAANDPLIRNLVLGIGIRERIERGVEQGLISVDFRGHFHGYSDGWFERQLTSMCLMGRHSEAFEILGNRDKGVNDTRPAILRDTMDRMVCNSCGDDVGMEISGDQMIATSECKNPDGYPPYHTRLNVPSGKLVFANDFRDLIEIRASFDINRTHGCRQTSEAYADAGMFHFFVGNTCPGVYQTGAGTLRVISGDQDECNIPGKEVGGICTDLWWFSAMDYDRFKKEAKRVYGKEWKDRLKNCDIVRVKPGCYKATSTYHRTRDTGLTYDEGGEIVGYEAEVYCTIKRDGNCRKLRTQSPYSAAFEFMKDFEVAVDIQRMAWPSLSRTREAVLSSWFLGMHRSDWKDGVHLNIGDKQIQAIKRYKAGERPPSKVEEDSFVVRWTERKAEEAIARGEPPPHRAFSQLDEDYGPFALPDDIRPDWLAGVREILHAVIDNGTGPEGNENYDRNKKNVKLAKKALKQIAKRFGEE